MQKPVQMSMSGSRLTDQWCSHAPALLLDRRDDICPPGGLIAQDTAKLWTALNFLVDMEIEVTVTGGYRNVVGIRELCLQKLEWPRGNKEFHIERQEPMNEVELKVAGSLIECIEKKEHPSENCCEASQQLEQFLFRRSRLEEEMFGVGVFGKLEAIGVFLDRLLDQYFQAVTKCKPSVVTVADINVANTDG